MRARTSRPARTGLTGLTALACAAALVAGAVPPAGAVVGGQEADPGEWPGQVALLVAGGIWCGGSLVAPDVVLTAAHCTDGMAPGSITVLAGTVDLAAGGQRRGVERIDQHQEFVDAALVNDISLLRLSEPFELNDAVQLVTLATPEQSDAFAEGGDPAVVTGWGAVSETGAGSPLLLEGDIEAFDDARCEELYREDGDSVFGDSQVCAGLEEGRVDACYGDSGGPLMVPADPDRTAWVQIGLVSWGAGCAAPLRPTVYTEVAAFFDWLTDRGLDVGGGRTIEGDGARLPARGTRGKASTYPLTVEVSGFTGDLASVSVRLVGLSHERPEDLDIWLVSPDGTTVALLSDAGGTSAIDAADVLVLDGAGGDGSTIGRSLAPVDRETDRQRKDGTAGAALAAFAGTDANGEWQLLIADDRSGAAGSLEGWSLSLR
jgi:trypsin